MEKRLVKRPWGGFRQFTLNEKSTVKILEIKPKKRTSLQYHENRSEFWRVLDNSLKITIGKKVIKAKKDDEFFVPKKTNHRLEGLNNTSHILEISFGNFKESDIKRLEDDFGRK